MSDSERDEIRELAERVAEIDKRLAVAEAQREAHRTETMTALSEIKASIAARTWTPGAITATASGVAAVLAALAGLITGHMPAAPTAQAQDDAPAQVTP